MISQPINHSALQHSPAGVTSSNASDTSPSVAPAPQQTFHDALFKASGLPPKEPLPLIPSVSEKTAPSAVSPAGIDPFTRLAADWEKAHKESSKLRQAVPPEFKPYLETQLLVQSVNTRMQVASSLCQSVGQCLRSLQQAAG